MKVFRNAIGALLLLGAPICSAIVIDIPDGDISEAHRALCLAAAGEQPVTLRLAYRGHYDFSILVTTAPAQAETGKMAKGPGIPPAFDFCTQDESGFRAPQDIMGKVIIEGRGSTITGFNLAIRDELTVRDTSFIGAENYFEIIVGGKLVIDRVGILGGMREPAGNRRKTAAINNRGELIMKNVTIADFLYGGQCAPGAAALMNHGTARINNSSFYQNRHALFECAEVAFDIWTAPDARTVVSNSIIGSAASPMNRVCIGPLQSRGNNFAMDGQCTQLDSASDRFVSLLSGTVQLRLLSHRYAVTPIAGSPAVDSRPAGSGVAECETTDQRGFLRDEPVTGACDAGAIELDAVPVIDPAHISGYWFDPANDGIYVHVNLLSPQRAVLMVQTFDESGAPAWYYGTGNPSETGLAVTLFRNDGVFFADGTLVGTVTPTPVGQAAFTFNDCFSASFEFGLADGGIGVASLQLDRLTFTEGLECINRR